MTKQTRRDKQLMTALVAVIVLLLLATGGCTTVGSIDPLCAEAEKVIARHPGAMRGASDAALDFVDDYISTVEEACGRT